MFIQFKFCLYNSNSNSNLCLYNSNSNLNLVYTINVSVLAIFSLIIMISNINYKGFLREGIEKLEFKTWKPLQCVMKYKDYTIVIFKSGKCRIMGCKKELDISTLPLPITIEKILGVSITFNYGRTINLMKWNAMDRTASYEPEIFPALRINDFNPLCVNVFSTGKVVVLGLKSLDFNDTLDKIILYMHMFVQ